MYMQISAKILKKNQMKLSKISNPYEFAKVIYYYVLQLRVCAMRKQSPDVQIFIQTSDILIYKYTSSHLA